jgi:hypothetical protein
MSNEHSNGNGNTVDRAKVPHVTITFDPVAFKVQVGGSITDADMLLAVLDQAKRCIESEIRKAQAIGIQNSMVQAAQDRAVVAALRKGA